MSLTSIFGEGAPALLVEFGEMCFVFCVDDVSAVSVRHHDIR